ncbi:Retrovirus-related Pol polyprotein from transposon TNT 1-94 [Durusdinium trenchii]|uniref:Retrovirus-related Pol polyprotein from transposon TNT 1-94 n=1 Tax=Durusdinium trenchii TaxID=1381693 RepID=A0ABP0KER0_9DINO
MAWALAQIYVIRAQHDPEVEAWVNYYDIFVRHAFGNLRDILREVTYNAEMGGFLNARGNRAKDRTGREPNENYAREVMQLFTIGLWKLNPDGSWKLNEEGEPIASYGQEDIMNFARVFTGLDYNIRRGNIEHTDGRNRIDPMRMNEWHHDIYPKTNLNGGYLGDGYPICSEAPEGSFLAQGARYNFVGKELPGEDFKVLRLEPTSELYQALCFASSGSSGHCRYNLTVQLADTLACHGAECTLEAKEVKFLNVSGGFYEYLEPTCVNLYFFSGMYSRHGGENWATDAQCRDVEHEKMGFECCDGCFKWFRTDEMRAKGLHCHSYRAWPEMYTEKCNHDPDWSYHKYCELHCWERGVGYGYNCSYGKFVGVRPCQYRREFVSFKEAQARCKALGLPLCRRNLRGKGCDYDRAHVWIDEACTEQVVVYPDGTVSSNSTKLSKFNPFSVNWKDGRWPKVQEGFCPGGCFAVGTVCSCNVTLEVRPVFATTPTASELAKLKIGAHPPTEDRCTSCGGEVRAYGSGDANTVFEYQGNFYSNKENLVVFHGGFEFRNPPVFMPRSGARPRHALAEVEELLDHLFHHPNTAPFISRLLIQRFGASSPSQEYILAVANAFKTGSYNGKTYSGRYGDLAATLAAILLHREGGSPLARTEGALREPILKLVHLMRSLEYRDLKDRPVVLGDLQDLMGQLPYAAPTVFNFYHSDYRPDSFPERMAAPEFEIFDPPRIVNFMNGMISLVDSGLSNCWRGFGRPAEACKAGELEAENLDCIGDTLEQLDLLLTGGRLQQSQSMLKGRALVKDSYERHGADRYKAAQKAILFSAEFNVIGNPLPQGLRPALNPQPPQTPMKDYKAVVLLYLSGGVDSFNMLVPMDCPLYEEYLEAREDVALDVGELHKITAANQVCSTFGLHPMLTAFKELYDEGHLAFAANVGSLAEPVNKTSYLHSDKKKCVAGRRLVSRKGQLPTMSFSMDGYAIWPSGRETIPNIVGTSHVSLRQREQLQAVVDNITSIRHENFYFEEYNRRVAAALQLDADLTKYLRNSLLKTSFEANDFDLTRQLRQVARLIAVREKRQVQRDLVDRMGCSWNSRTGTRWGVVARQRFSELNHALTQFTQELKAQGVFESVVLATQSDFARTLTPNSQRGTDHGWAGHYVLLGGGIKGGQIFNQYPSSLKLDSELDLGQEMYGDMVPPQDPFFASKQKQHGRVPAHGSLQEQRPRYDERVPVDALAREKALELGLQQDFGVHRGQEHGHDFSLDDRKTALEQQSYELRESVKGENENKPKPKPGPKPKGKAGAPAIGRGRLVPKHPYENFLVPIAEWMGVELSQMKESVDLGEETEHKCKQTRL